MSAKKKSPKKGAVAKVWEIASKLGPKAERKDVLVACAAAGINKATAATQYQRWSKATPAQRKAKLESKKTPAAKEAPQSMKKAA